MDSKEKQRLLSMINDYNAYKNKGGRLYEISVETNTKAEFLCRGVLRLYWDIQRPIVLNKEATSSFVQKRSRTSNIVGRPASSRGKAPSQDKPGPSPGKDPQTSPTLGRDTCTEDTEGSKKNPAPNSPRFEENCRGRGSPPSASDVAKKSVSPGIGSGTGGPHTRDRSSTFMGALDLTFRSIRSSSVGSRTSSGSLPRSTSKSSLASRNSDCSSTLDPEGMVPHGGGEEGAGDLLQPGSCGAATSPRSRNSSNISRYITSSFRRVKSSPLESGCRGMRPSTSSAQVYDLPTDSPDLGAAGDEAKTDTAKSRKRNGTSFRKKRRSSQTAIDTEDVVDDVLKAVKPCAETPEKGSGRISGLIHRHISFRRKSRSPCPRNPVRTGDSSENVLESVTVDHDGPESIAEFYQPPKGSLTNIRATSDMTATEVVAATLNKLNAVDEPSRFAVFAIDDRGTVKLIQDGERMLLYRIRLGPKEEVAKLFIMERDTNDAQDFSTEVMQYYHLGMPFLERLIVAYEDEEEKEIERVQLRYADLRQRLEAKALAAQQEDLELSNKQSASSE